MTLYSIVWSTKALSDLAECIQFLFNVSKQAAINLKNEAFSCATGLEAFPEKNPIFEMPKSFPFVLRKQIVSKRYILLYTIEKDKIVIYRMLDCRKQFGALI